MFGLAAHTHKGRLSTVPVQAVTDGLQPEHGAAATLTIRSAAMRRRKRPSRRLFAGRIDQRTAFEQLSQLGRLVFLSDLRTVG